MLNDLNGYCSRMSLTPSYNDENGSFYKGLINTKIFSLCRMTDEVRITTFDDTIFNSFCAVLQPKYKTLLTIRRNVNMLGECRPYNFIQFVCAKETKVKSILAQFEKVYFDMIEEKNEKVGI